MYVLFTPLGATEHPTIQACFDDPAMFGGESVVMLADPRGKYHVVVEHLCENGEGPWPS